METKKFDKTLYNECDKKGKDVSIKLLNAFGYSLKDDSEVFKLRDLIVSNGENDIWIESEYSPTWTSDAWPTGWKLTCPYRKKDSKAHIYIRINSTMTTAIVIPMKTVHSSPVIIKNTCYTKNEKFYHVNIEDCDFFDLTNIDKTKNRFIKSN